MPPQLLPTFYLGYHAPEDTWMESLRWMDPNTGASGELTLDGEPFPQRVLRGLDRLILATAWPVLDLPQVYPQPVLHTHSWADNPSQRRVIQRLARARHWNVLFDWDPAWIPID